MVNAKKRVVPPPIPKSIPADRPRTKFPVESGMRLRAEGVLRLRCTRRAVFFDEVLVFPNGKTIVALEGEPQLVYASLEAMIYANGLEAHELVAFE
jgi:hypothetical protein